MVALRRLLCRNRALRTHLLLSGRLQLANLLRCSSSLLLRLCEPDALNLRNQIVAVVAKGRQHKCLTFIFLTLSAILKRSIVFRYAKSFSV